jgi:hypothetical protein
MFLTNESSLISSHTVCNRLRSLIRYVALKISMPRGKKKGLSTKKFVDVYLRLSLDRVKKLILVLFAMQAWAAKRNIEKASKKEFKTEIINS